MSRLLWCFLNCHWLHVSWKCANYAVARCFVSAYASSSGSAMTSSHTFKPPEPPMPPPGHAPEPFVIFVAYQNSGRMIVDCSVCVFICGLMQTIMVNV